jgi:HCOMODA/2-hydroxy-3-carboxy-muconic semialdehyde decarboxylase
MTESKGRETMPDALAQAKHDLAVANRIVSHEGIIDAFGHVSMRHPTKPDRYLISRSRSPEVVEASDIYEYTLDSEPVTPLPPGIRGYGELVIHGEIYKARPDVNAVAHHHGMAMLPFCNVGVELKPLYHMGAQIGDKVAFWDSREEFGDTSLLVIKPEEGRSLAKALGPNWLVLMRRHGATVAGRNLIELTFRTIYQYRNAELQLMTQTLGLPLSPLTPGESKLAQARNLEPRPQARAWEYWCTRLKKAGEYPPGVPKARPAPTRGRQPRAAQEKKRRRRR